MFLADILRALRTDVLAHDAACQQSEQTPQKRQLAREHMMLLTGSLRETRKAA